jgi:hypothetical protein
MVVGDFDIAWSFLFPLETDSIPVVNSNAILTPSIALQRLEAVPANGREILKAFGRMQAHQSSAGLIFDLDKFYNTLIGQQSRGAGILERLDHTTGILP